MKVMIAALAAMAIAFCAALVAGGSVQLPTRSATPTALPAATPAPPKPAELAYRQLLARLAEYDRLYAINWWPHLSPAAVEKEIDRRGADGDTWLRDYLRSPGGRLYFAWSTERKRFLQAPSNRILADYLDWLTARGQPRQPNTAILRDVDTLADFLYPYVSAK